MEVWVGIVGGLGIGSVLTSLVNHFVMRRASVSDRWYQEKPEAYLGLITALQSVSGDIPGWLARCALFGSPEVRDLANQVTGQQVPVTSPAFPRMLEAIRDDLRR